MAGKTVSTRYVPLHFTVPAGTLPTAPAVSDLALGDVLWEQTQIIIPSGHIGLTGVRFEFSGEPIVPWGRPASWIIADDADMRFDVMLEVGAPVKVVGYNTDFFDHTFHTYTRISDRVLAGRAGSVTVVPIA